MKVQIIERIPGLAHLPGKEVEIPESIGRLWINQKYARILKDTEIPVYKPDYTGKRGKKCR
jgi:hypothetical protein